MEMAFTWSNAARLLSRPQLHASSDDLQGILDMDVLTDGSASQAGNRVTCRSSDQGAGQKQLAPAQDSGAANWFVAGSAPGMGDIE